jgi:sugar-specific transcriptional regulator TrmB
LIARRGFLMIDPNEVLTEILSEEDEEFRALHKKLKELEKEFCIEPDESKKKLLMKNMRGLKERVDARISFARSA